MLQEGEVGEDVNQTFIDQTSVVSTQSESVAKNLTLLALVIAFFGLANSIFACSFGMVESAVRS